MTTVIKAFGELDDCHLEVTRTCNLRCKYCYATEESHDSPVMTASMALSCVECLFASSHKEDISITFHGGEPLLAPVAWYEDVCGPILELSRTYRKNVRFHIQTNGTLINDSQIAIFKKYGFIVGLSMDGPPAVNDRVRGQGDRSLRAISLLKEANVYPGILLVVSRQTLPDLDAVLDFFLENNLARIQTNMILQVGRARNGDVALSADGLFEARLKLMGRILKDPPGPVDLRTLEILGHFLKPRTEEQMKALGCGQPFCHAGIKLILFDSQGRIYPCGPSAHLERNLLGSLDDFSETRYWKVIADFHNRDKTRLEKECRHCPASRTCTFGCSAEGGMNETGCRANRALHEYLGKCDQGELRKAYDAAYAIPPYGYEQGQTP